MRQHRDDYAPGTPPDWSRRSIFGGNRTKPKPRDFDWPLTWPVLAVLGIAAIVIGAARVYGML